MDRVARGDPECNGRDDHRTMGEWNLEGLPSPNNTTIGTIFGIIASTPLRTEPRKTITRTVTRIVAVNVL